MKYLFTVTDHFDITGRGLVLVPGVSVNVNPGDRINLIRPDKTQVETIIRSVEMFRPPTPIVVGKEMTKELVPIGTEVWLVE